MHRANPYTASMTARDVRRATIIDDGPFAWGVMDQEVAAAKQKAEKISMGQLDFPQNP